MLDIKVKLELEDNSEDIIGKEALSVFIKNKKCDKCGGEFTRHKENKNYNLECKKCKSKILFNFEK